MYEVSYLFCWGSTFCVAATSFSGTFQWGALLSFRMGHLIKRALKFFKGFSLGVEESQVDIFFIFTATIGKLLILLWWIWLSIVLHKDNCLICTIEQSSNRFGHLVWGSFHTEKVQSQSLKPAHASTSPPPSCRQSWNGALALSSP